MYFLLLYFIINAALSFSKLQTRIEFYWKIIEKTVALEFNKVLSHF